jgi:hypothetical protein
VAILWIAADSNYGITGAGGMGAAYRATGAEFNGDDSPARCCPTPTLRRWRRMEGRAGPLKDANGSRIATDAASGRCRGRFPPGSVKHSLGCVLGPGTVTLPK